MIYLDNAATTKVLPRVFNEMTPFLTRYYGNPDSPHEAGRVAREAVEKARKRIDALIHANGTGKIIFTSGGTESNNMAFRILGDYPLAMNIITSKTEHKSVLEPARSARCSSLKLIKPGKKGYIDLTDLSPNEIPAFTLVSLMYMNNETGMVNEVYGIGDMLKQFADMDVFYHVDCVQAAGSLLIDVLKMNADMISISSHKLHGPKGVGCLWVSDRLLKRLSGSKSLSLILGGGQEDGFRAGTMNVSGIVGFGKAAEISEAQQDAWKIYHDLSEIFEETLAKRCKELGIKHILNTFSPKNHFDKVLSITFPYADAETVVLMASEKGLCISAGAACNSESSEPSYVLTSSGVSANLARNTVRVSFSPFNSYTDVTEGAQILANTVNEVLKLNLTDAVS